MPKDQGSKEPRPSPYCGPSGRSTGRTVGPVLSGEERNRQPPLPDPNIAHSSQSFLNGAQDFQMGDFQQFNVSINSRPEPVDGWKLLVNVISSNALHNSSARYDAPKCDEDTRVELTRELMDRIRDRDHPQRLLCMTGAAGSGKSALQQTIAEICAESGILGSAYFFSNGDHTRNTVSNVVPTIAFQMGSHNVALRHAISAVVAQDPVIFDKSLRAQMSSLLVHPLRYLHAAAGLNLTTLPYAILIDGLDECQGEDRQNELLIAIRECLLADDLSFCVFTASRPEWAIRTALAQGGHLHAVAYHIQLSDHYDASGDMRRYLRRRFELLSVQTGNPRWFTDENIETLVEAGSGQFIYVSTVYRWISERRASPTQRLKIVLTWTPAEEQRARPFEVLDKLYTNILLNAKKAYEAVDTHFGRDFLLLFKIHHHNVVSGFTDSAGFTRMLSERELTGCLGLEPESFEILISDLHSLGSMGMANSSTSYLRILHKSFSDFLDAESRAKDLFVPTHRVYTHLAKCCFRIIESPSSDFLTLATSRFPMYWVTGLARLDDEIIDFTQKGGWRRIDSVHIRYKEGYCALLEHFDRLTEGLKERNPEVVEIMRSFFLNWAYEYRKHRGWAGARKE